MRVCREEGNRHEKCLFPICQPQRHRFGKCNWKRRQSICRAFPCLYHRGRLSTLSHHRKASEKVIRSRNTHRSKGVETAFRCLLHGRNQCRDRTVENDCLRTTVRCAIVHKFRFLQNENTRKIWFSNSFITGRERCFSGTIGTRCRYRQNLYQRH